MVQAAPGRYETAFTAAETGLYRLTQGDLARVIAVGPSAPREFEDTMATGAVAEAAVAATGGGVLALTGGRAGYSRGRDGAHCCGAGVDRDHAAQGLRDRRYPHHGAVARMAGADRGGGADGGGVACRRAAQGGVRFGPQV